MIHNEEVNIFSTWIKPLDISEDMWYNGRKRHNNRVSFFLLIFIWLFYYL